MGKERREASDNASARRSTAESSSRYAFSARLAPAASRPQGSPGRAHDAPGDPRRSPSQQQGFEAETRAYDYLQERGLHLVARNVGSRLGEIDLIMRDRDTWVFVEVRQRSRQDFGGAAASVTPAKQARLRRQAQRYLQSRFGDRWPACRFDVIAIEADSIDWIVDAF